jgi:hypothetical protein
MNAIVSLLKDILTDLAEVKREIRELKLEIVRSNKSSAEDGAIDEVSSSIPSED